MTLSYPYVIAFILNSLKLSNDLRHQGVPQHEKFKMVVLLVCIYGEAEMMVTIENTDTFI